MSGFTPYLADVLAAYQPPAKLTPDEEASILAQTVQAAGDVVPGNVRQPVSFARTPGPPAPVNMGELPSPFHGAYDPNPASPTYQPNPGASGAPVAAKPAGAVLGALPAPVDGGELPGPPVGALPPPAIDGGEIGGPPVGAQVEVGAPAPGPDPHAFELQAGVGGAAPAREQELRGPSLLAAQGHRNDTVEGAIGAVTNRNQQAAEEEYQMAVTQERSARLREAAYQQSVAEQEDELASRQADFDATTKQMSRLGQVDQGRFWASRSTGQKIAGALEVMLAGFRGAPSMVMKRIDDDVKAQEFAYGAARDQANAKQTAFSAAMAKYQNVNAARAAAHVASIDVLQAQLSQTAAKNKGNETGNRAIMAIADLDNEKMLQIQQGIRFMPAVAGGRYWKDPSTGLVYNETEAKALRAKQVEYGQQERVKTFDLGADIYKAHDKASLEASPDGSPMTKEQRGKIASEQYVAQRASDEFNSQMDHLLTMPAIEKDGLAASLKTKALGSRLAPDSNAVVQSIEDINQQVMASAGGVAKDAEGKLTQIARERLEHAYKLEASDTPAVKRQKLEGARNFINTLARQQGAGSAPRPNNQVATPAELSGLEKSTSLKLHGGK